MSRIRLICGATVLVASIAYAGQHERTANQPPSLAKAPKVQAHHAPPAPPTCIDKEKIGFGGDFDSYHYTYFCPHYQFSYAGDKSRRWSILNPIDLRQVEPAVLPVKQDVERRIQEYAGQAFASRLRFHSVDVVYPDSIAKFAGLGSGVNMARCQGKYFFYYRFYADPAAFYRVGLAVDADGRILSPFRFPRKAQYQPVDTTLTVCKAIARARQVRKRLGPIEQVRFDYNQRSGRFVWLVSEEVRHPQQGRNIYTKLEIDAADASRVRVLQDTVYLSH